VSFIYDTEDGKQIAVNFAPGTTDTLVVTMKDGHEYSLPAHIGRTLAFLIMKMTGEHTRRT
jgi:hypothetical protein